MLPVGVRGHELEVTSNTSSPMEGGIRASCRLLISPSCADVHAGGRTPSPLIRTYLLLAELVWLQSDPLLDPLDLRCLGSLDKQP
jgi:hypothetical protein